VLHICVSVAGFDHIEGDSNRLDAVRAKRHRSLDDDIGLQLAGDLGNAALQPLECHHRRSSFDVHRTDTAERVDQAIGQPVDEVLLRRIARQVDERQHCDRSDHLRQWRRLTAIAPVQPGGDAGDTSHSKCDGLPAGEYAGPIQLTQHCGERIVKFPRRLKALPRIALERLAEDVGQAGRQRRIDVVGAARQRVRHLDQLDRVHVLVRSTARRQLEQDDAETVQIGAVIGFSADHLFRRHVGWRSGARPFPVRLSGLALGER
jgi:hypothetical protein